MLYLRVKNGSGFFEKKFHKIFFRLFYAAFFKPFSQNGSSENCGPGRRSSEDSKALSRLYGLKIGVRHIIGSIEFQRTGSIAARTVKNDW